MTLKKWLTAGVAAMSASLGPAPVSISYAAADGTPSAEACAALGLPGAGVDYAPVPAPPPIAQPYAASPPPPAPLVAQRPAPPPPPPATLSAESRIEEVVVTG